MHEDDINTQCRMKYDAVTRAIAALKEHVDTVQIFVTARMPDENGSSQTFHLELGDGNIYARRGQIDQWLRNERTEEAIKTADEVEDRALNDQELEEEDDDA